MFFIKTADNIVSKFTKTVADLEKHMTTKALEIEEHALQIVRYDQLSLAAQTEYDKAKKYANKLKDFFA